MTDAEFELNLKVAKQSGRVTLKTGQDRQPFTEDRVS